MGLLSRHALRGSQQSGGGSCSSGTGVSRCSQAGITILPQALPSDSVVDNIMASAPLDSDNEAPYLTG